MNWKFTLILVTLVYFFNTTYAQQYISGKVYSAATEDILAKASVTNTTTNKTIFTEYNGTFKIFANEGDRLEISYVGYWPQTITTTDTLLLNGIEIRLKLKPEDLEKVIVQQSYQRDSAERRNAYQHIWDHKPNITGNNTPVGFGITLSPLSYFSKKEKNINKQKKRLAHQEELFYIDYKFSKEHIARITGLKGDSLSMFRNMNRPTYKFCRKASYEDMTLYIINKYTAYLKRK